MGEVEKGLAAFLAAYNPFLDQMSEFATPLIVGLLKEAYKVPEDKRRGNPGLKEAGQKVFADLEAKVQHFTAMFNALPIPSGATVERTQLYQFPLSDLFVFRLKPRLLKPRHGEPVLYNGSDEGHVEMEFATMQGKFWSPWAWDAGEPARIGVKNSTRRSVPIRSIGNAEFNLSVVGTGELDAFLQYAAKSVIPAEAKK